MLLCYTYLNSIWFPTDKEPRGIIPLENIRVREVPGSGGGGKQHCFELYSSVNEVIKACKTDSEGKVVEGGTTLFGFHYCFEITTSLSTCIFN